VRFAPTARQSHPFSPALFPEPVQQAHPVFLAQADFIKAMIVIAGIDPEELPEGLSDLPDLTIAIIVHAQVKEE
jgi:hypothetical protein